MAMLAAVAIDFAAAGVRVSTLLTPRCPEIPGVRCEHGRVADERRNFDRLVADSDVVLVIAPEFDDHLLHRLQRQRVAFLGTVEHDSCGGSLECDEQISIVGVW
jgi:predicted ATP-grasp superfamily ATP-dependent carboligase